MTDTPEYTPPEVWVWDKDDSPKWRYSNTNRPIAGATHEKSCRAESIRSSFIH
jgi:GSH-dependent disulfide-bond oxidoreductase